MGKRGPNTKYPYTVLATCANGCGNLARVMIHKWEDRERRHFCCTRCEEAYHSSMSVRRWQLRRTGKSTIAIGKSIIVDEHPSATGKPRTHGKMTERDFVYWAALRRVWGIEGGSECTT